MEPHEDSNITNIILIVVSLFVAALCATYIIHPGSSSSQPIFWMGLFFCGGSGIALLMIPCRNHWVSLMGYFFGMVGMTAASAAIFAINPQYPILFRIVGLIGVILFGFGGMIAIVQRVILFFNNKHALEMDEEGLVVRGMRVYWKNVVEIQQFDKYQVMVATNDCKERIAQAPRPKRWLMKLNYLMYNAVIFIPNVDIPGNYRDFLSQCNKYRSTLAKPNTTKNH